MNALRLSPRWAWTALALIALLALAGAIWTTRLSPAPEVKTRPVATIKLTREQTELVRLTLAGAPKLAEAQAKTLNADLPFSGGTVRGARPFAPGFTSASAHDNALKCLTQAIYYEAGFEPIEGRRAVAQVVLNRVRHPAFPHSVCGVVYQGANQPVCQFSFVCDGSLRRMPEAGAWRTARRIAEEALAGAVVASVGMATHYHADYVFPYWAPRLAKIEQIGAHIFYRWPGGWGMPRAFLMAYSGHEYIPAIDSRFLYATRQVIDESLPEVARLPERRADNDLGGRLDPSKGWTLAIPNPAATKGAFDRIAARQAVPGTATATVAILPAAPKKAETVAVVLPVDRPAMGPSLQ